MKITTTRQISQIFFFLLFVWLAFCATLGENWWQLRGWPVRWFLQLDPLVGLGTLLANHTLYQGLSWGLLTVGLTLVLGRFFCGWLCPFGALHQWLGNAARRRQPLTAQIKAYRYHPGQAFKYGVLAFLLAEAGFFSLSRWWTLPLAAPGLAVGLTVAVLWIIGIRLRQGNFAVVAITVMTVLGFAGLSVYLDHYGGAAFTDGLGQLQIGLLDPIAFFQRALHVVVFPLAALVGLPVAGGTRFYVDSWLIGVLLVTTILLNWHTPRFFCRFVCPLGALFGLLSRFSLLRMGKAEEPCRGCMQCSVKCEGACEPFGQIRTAECLLCFNCLDHCPDTVMDYSLQPPAGGEIKHTNLSRRAAVLSLTSGAISVCLGRVPGLRGIEAEAALVRPPGALGEVAFLARCIQCGLCMRVCPTNVIHPAGWQTGLEALWTPVLDFRVGTSGCQLNCIACGHVCPTAAIRPLQPDERTGKNAFAALGPVRIGLAFVDRGRCLPWAMERPCIVCQENCPVSPKAIRTRTVFEPLLWAPSLTIARIEDRRLIIREGVQYPQRVAGGDYYLHPIIAGPIQRQQVIGATADSLLLAQAPAWSPTIASGQRLQLTIRLQQPVVDPALCIGCGVCEHECPIKGKAAIRVTAENATRDPRQRVLLPQKRPGA
jgi:polyferredoxin